MKEDSVVRVETKYLPDEVTASTLRSRLQAVIPADPTSGAAGHMVRFLYFDMRA